MMVKNNREIHTDLYSEKRPYDNSDNYARKGAIRDRWKNSGMTMMETLAAFAILMIITSSLIGIIEFSSRMSMDAADRRTMGADLNELLAHKTSDDSMNPRFMKAEVMDGEESSLKLIIDTEMTDPSNYSESGLGGTPAEIELHGCTVYQLPYPDALNPEITVLRFEYDSTLEH